jgi:hypothetical protein
MPDSSAPRKREDTSWPEHADRRLTNAERQRRFKAKQRGEDPDKVVPRRIGQPVPAPVPEPDPVPEIPPDPEGTEPEQAQDRSVRDAVAASVAQWGKTMDPLASVALGLAQTFDSAVDAGSVGAATLADRLVSVLDRLRPVSGGGSVPTGAQPGAKIKVTDPAELVARRRSRLAEEARGS